MTASEYLAQARELSFEIEAKKRELATVKQNAQSLQSPTIGEKVMSTPMNSTNNQSDKAVDLENVIKKEITKLIDLQAEIHARINRLADHKYITILTDFFVNCLTVEKIAENMNYSTSQIKRCKNKAVKEFAELYGFVKDEPK